MTTKHTHLIGVRVNDEELRRLKLRAQVMPGSAPLATYLRQRGLDVEPKPDPDPQLLGALERVAAALEEARDAWRRRFDAPDVWAEPWVSSDDLWLERLNHATDLLRELGRRID